MSHRCHDEHEHASGGHGSHDPHAHQHGAPPIPTNESQSLNSKISTAELSALNIENPLSELPKLFKSSSDKYKLTPCFKSDCDNQLIIRIPFEGSVKLYSITLRTSKIGNNCPKSVKLFKNESSIDFDNVNSKKPTFALEQPQVGIDDSEPLTINELKDDSTFVEHFLPRHQFGGITSLTIFFENNHTEDEDEILKLYSIDLRGEYKALNKDPVVVLYESAANPADHKNLLAAENGNLQNL
ncbi:hypothetical protein CANARDRAFT_28424 [[Candida] arabinofermentans NRRL YB-2248]|uniref:PITH domain-containing protein n=1 Tax=[Candida] arabinofermentans NRRL YB-2248 TaxID=983967 RepID=A0A1E4T043_9ASCO|nr:hypothetical protein CANARDRAFT_28424 [[Candida] arabinofermentans NRRL YB-2248]